jgi:hypothetical protein
MLNKRFFQILCFVLWVTITGWIAPTVNAQEKPSWLNEYPADPRYYIGVGSALKSDDASYQQAARESALAELISQIEVNVSTTMEFLEQEQDESYENFFSAFTQTQARKTIEDYEIVDSYDDGSEFWMYIRLSKSDYERRLQEKMSIAKRSATTALKDGSQAFASGDYELALSSFTNGLADIAPYIDRPMEVNYEGQNIDLFAELRSNLRDVVALYRIVDSGGPTAGQVGKSGESPFKLRLEYKDSGNPVEGVPIGFRFIRGSGDFSSAVLTNSEDEVSVELNKITAPDAMQIITGGIAFSAFSDDESSSFLTSVFDGVNAPNARFVLRVSGVPIYLEYNETFLGQNETSNYLQPVIKEQLNEAGYSFIEDLASAELYIEVDAETRQGSETYGIYSAFVSYRVTVTNMLTGREEATYSDTDIKGLSDNYEKAAAKAFEAAIMKLESEILPNLIDQIQK